MADSADEKDDTPSAQEPTADVVDAVDDDQEAATEDRAEGGADPLSHPDGAAKLDASEIENLLDQATQSLDEAAGDQVSTDATAKPYSLNDLSPDQELAERQPIDLLGEVEMDLRIELGRTQMRLEEVLGLRNGSVVALDKLAGDPVDVFVNGRLIAKGEVLVMNDNFCIRVTELVGA